MVEMIDNMSTENCTIAAEITMAGIMDKSSAEVIESPEVNPAMKGNIMGIIEEARYYK